MPKILAATLAGLATMFTAQAASADPVGLTSMQDAAFQSVPVADDDLASAAGGALRTHFDLTARAIAQQDTQAFYDQTGQSARIAMDNWWAQTGAALIDNNLLAAQASR